VKHLVVQLVGLLKLLQFTKSTPTHSLAAAANCLMCTAKPLTHLANWKNKSLLTRPLNHLPLLALRAPAAADKDGAKAEAACLACTAQPPLRSCCCLAAALRIAARALAPARQRPKAGRLPPSLQTLSAGLLQREQEPGVTAYRRCSLQLACGAVRGGRTSRPARLETAPAAAAGWCVHFLQERTEKGQKGKRKSSSKTTLIDSNQEPRRAQESRASVPFESQYKSSKIHGKFLNLGEKREGERKTERGRKGGDPGGRRAPLFLLTKSPSK